MGNTNSNVTSGVKKQADTGSLAIYKLVDLKGGGCLVDLLKDAAKTKTTTSEELDQKIVELVQPFLYNEGEGQMVPVTEMVLARCVDTPQEKQLQEAFKALNSQSQDANDKGSKANVDANGQVNKEKNVESRFVCWRLDQRGAVGETILHMCLLNASSIHADLAKRLIRLFPNLINDYYMSDEYYGETALHMAIVNEDLPTVKFLLDNGADCHVRSFGSFFCPEDQKSSREDTIEHEWVKVCVDTNYEGYVYWGEYALSFAACLGQEESYRLTLAKGADPDLQDTNGNTVLHMLVIHEKLDMFNMAFEMGASMDIKNNQELTPLTLAAKLAKKDMFFHILKLEREIYWQIGGIVCSAYPLQHIDTIDTTTGEINNISALNLIVYGDKEAHLELMDKMVMDLLNAKWNSFVKFRFYKSFAMFCTYFVLSITCFGLRPGPGESNTSDQINGTTALNNTIDNSTSIFNSTLIANLTENVSTIINASIMDTTDVNVTVLAGLLSIGNNVTKVFANATEMFSNITEVFSNRTLIESLNVTFENDTRNATEVKEAKYDPCYLIPTTSTVYDLIRWVAEIGTVSGAIWYLAVACHEASFLGYHLFLESMKTVPSRVLFLISCLLAVSMVFLRLSCAHKTEDVVAVLVMLSTAPYFLYFCRGFKIVGPFVVMVYKMIMGDLLRFVTIYLVFVLGFSQAFFVIFLTHRGEDNYFQDPVESILASFVMSLQEFADMYQEFDNTSYPEIAKILFIMYMALVAILLINMLIAMMGNTYQIIAETRNEWQRQWARIVLVVERGVPPRERLSNQVLYSQPMADGRKAFVVRTYLSNDEKIELLEIHDIKVTHIKNAKRKAKGSNILSSPSSSPKKGNSNPGSVPSL